jgi:hypothetical protein
MQSLTGTSQIQPDEGQVSLNVTIPESTYQELLKCGPSVERNVRSAVLLWVEMAKAQKRRAA